MRLSALCDDFAQVTFVEPMEGYVRRMLWAAAADGAIPPACMRRSLGPGASAGGAARRRADGGACPLVCGDDFERFRRELPRDVAGYIREAYGIDLTARYLGYDLPHPIGKGSGQLSLNLEQLETDRAAGLAFVVLKTRHRRERRRRAIDGRVGHPRDQDAGRAARQCRRGGRAGPSRGRAGDGTALRGLPRPGARRPRPHPRRTTMLVVPSVKLHLPRLDEPFRDDEYRHTIGRIAEAGVAARCRSRRTSPRPSPAIPSPTSAPGSSAGCARCPARIREAAGRARSSSRSS